MVKNLDKNTVVSKEEFTPVGGATSLPKELVPKDYQSFLDILVSGTAKAVIYVAKSPIYAYSAIKNKYQKD